MPHLSIATSLLLLLSGILFVSMASQINVVTAKVCTDKSNSNDKSSSCNSQDSSHTNSLSRNDGKTPFVLPFP